MATQMLRLRKLGKIHPKEVKYIIPLCLPMLLPTACPSRPQNSDVLLKECINFVRSRFQRLPHSQKAKAAFIESLMGMMLATFGISSKASYGPVAVPDHFRAVRGRPRKAA